MQTNERLTSLIVKLNRLTALDEIKWSVAEPPRSVDRGTDDYIPLFFTTEFKGQRFALFQQRYQQYDGEHDNFYWTERLTLAILDSEDRMLWEYSGPSSSLYDLLATVRAKVANIDKLLDDLLNDSK